MKRKIKSFFSTGILMLIFSMFIVTQSNIKPVFAEETEKLDLSNWMKQLSPYIDNLSINNIILPGTHDSGTSSITDKSPFAQDATDIMKKINWMGPKTLAGLSKTQDKNIKEQLELGVRYFDLRVAPNPNDNNELYFVHAKYGDSASIAIKDIKNFIESHDREIVILDFQHLYGMNKDNYRNLMSLLRDNLKNYMAPAIRDTLNKTTLKSLCDNNKRVIVSFKDSIYNEVFNLDNDDMKTLIFRRSASITSPWIDDEWNYKTLIPKLQLELDKKPSNTLFVSQCISSFSNTRYVDNFMRGKSIYDFTKNLNPEVIKWVKNNPTKNFNIIMVDFCNYPYNFTEEIIKCNIK